MKLELGWRSGGDLFAVKPRCKYWDNLHERLIPSLPHIFKDLIAYFPRNSPRKQRKKGVEGEQGIGEKKGRDRCRIELGANSALNLQTISKLWVHNFFPPASSWWCSLFWLGCVSSLQSIRWAKYRSPLADPGQKDTGGEGGNRQSRGGRKQEWEWQETHPWTELSLEKAINSQCSIALKQQFVRERKHWFAVTMNL